MKSLGNFGYTQKGNRYFWRIGATTKYNQGFRSKKECEEWINEKRDEYLFDWRAGFMVKFRKFESHWILVDRRGNEIKAF